MKDSSFLSSRDLIKSLRLTCWYFFSKPTLDVVSAAFSLLNFSKKLLFGKLAALSFELQEAVLKISRAKSPKIGLCRYFAQHCSLSCCLIANFGYSLGFPSVQSTRSYYWFHQTPARQLWFSFWPQIVSLPPRRQSQDCWLRLW